MLRAQLPVHSPLPLAALASGARAALAGGRAARAQVEAALGATYAPRALLLTDSGTSALALALTLAARDQPGPAALPAFCCYDIATATDAAGVRFVLYDLDPATLAPEPASLGRALDAGARTIVVVHLYGVPVSLDAIATLLRPSGAVLIEDAAQAAGTRLGTRTAGSVGDYGVLSFARGKAMTAGRGGALLANRAAAAGAVEAAGTTLAPATGGARAAGAHAAQWLLARPSLYGLPASLPFLRLGETVYHPPRAPRRPPAFALGVLARTQSLVSAEAAIRRTHARRLLDALAAGTALRGFVAPAGTEPGYLRLPAIATERAVGATRTAEARALGVWPSYPRSLADLPGFGARRLNREEAFPGAGDLARRLVTLPTHAQLHRRDLEALERWIARLT